MADAVDPFGGLTGANRDAYAAITNTLKAYGLESLAPTVLGYIQQGYTSDTISVLLPETPEYKKRFAGNTARKAAGLPVLSPAEYLSVEGSYRAIMSAAGLPVGFYDNPDDFTKWISDDVSPTEIQSRVKVASDLVNNLDGSAKEAFSQWYTHGDLVAYALDRERATTVLEHQAQAAKAGGIAREQGLGLSQQTAEQIAQLGATDGQIQSGLATARELRSDVGRLSVMYGGTYDDEAAVNDVFFESATSKTQRKGLASQERGTFGGSAGTTAGALSNRKGGQV